MKTKLLIVLLLAVLTACADTTVSGVPGSKLTVTVTADGTTPLTYQWKKNGVDLPGATEASYTVAAMSVSDFGEYTCLVANEAGSVLSDKGICIRIMPPTSAKSQPVIVKTVGGNSP